MTNGNVYFENQQNVVLEQLRLAKYCVDIAVAWINFDEYLGCFTDLLQKNVVVRVIVDENVANLKYSSQIDGLIKIGMKFKSLKMPKSSAYMHHKFCVIDNFTVLSGSYNWTKNANNNNCEDLSVSCSSVLASQYTQQFNMLWELSMNDLKLLRNPDNCENCCYPKAYICAFRQNGDYYTDADIYEVCGCECNYVRTIYFDVSVYLNIQGIIDKYSEIENMYYQDDEASIQNNIEQMNIEMNEYLSNVRKVRMDCPIIHAVGIIGWRCFPYPYKDDGEWIINILWKERYSSKYVADEYPLE